MSPDVYTGGGAIEFQPGITLANAGIHSFAGTTAAAVTTALKPTFTPVVPSVQRINVTALGARVGTAVGGSTVGCALYSIAYTAAGTYLATLVAQLNASISTAAATGIVLGAVTTGAPASGAGTYVADFGINQYVLGVMASTVTTLTLHGVAPISGMGCLSWTAAARSSVTDWPASFTQASGVANAAARVNACWIFDADGQNWL